MASAPPQLTPPALASLDLFRSLGAEVSLAVCGAVIQGVLRSSLLSSLRSPSRSKHGPRSEAEINGIIDQVRRSLSSLSDLDPHTQALVRDAYAGAVTWVLGICVVFCALALAASLGIREVPLVGRERKSGKSGYGGCDGSDVGEEGGTEEVYQRDDADSTPDLHTHAPANLTTHAPANFQTHAPAHPKTQSYLPVRPPTQTPAYLTGHTHPHAQIHAQPSGQGHLPAHVGEIGERGGRGEGMGGGDGWA